MQIIKTIRLVFIASLFIVFYLSIVPASDIPNFQMLSDITDKAVHAVIYFYLGTAWFNTISTTLLLNFRTRLATL